MNKRRFSLGDILRKLNEDSAMNSGSDDSSPKIREDHPQLSFPKMPEENHKIDATPQDLPEQPQIGSSESSRRGNLHDNTASTEAAFSQNASQKESFYNKGISSRPHRHDHVTDHLGTGKTDQFHFLDNHKAQDEEDEEEFDIFRYIGILIRRRNAVLAVMILFTIFSIFKFFTSDKFYTTSARLLFRPNNEQMLGDQDPWSYYYTDREKVFNTHLELLRSNTVLSLVSQNLDNKISVGEIQSGLAIKQGETDGQKTDIIELTYKNRNPDMTRDVLNELCNTYIDYRRGVNAQEITRLIHKFEIQIGKLQTELDLKEGDLRHFKEENRLVQLSSETNLTVSKLADMELALQQSQLSLVETKEKLTALNSQISGQEKDIVQSITFQDPFQNRLADLELQLNTLSAEYSPEHYKVRMVKEQIEKLKAATIDSITREASSRTLVKNPIRQSLLQDLVNFNIENAALETKRAAQEKIIEQLNQDLLKLPSLEQKYAYLQRETESILQTLQMLKTKYEEAKVRRDSQESDLKLLELAQTPESAINATKLSSVFIGILIGLILGIALAFLLEYLDQSLKDPLEIERSLELPLLGIVPLIEADKGLLESTNDLTKSILEPFRALRANIKHIAAAHEMKTFIVCSAVKGEGKTTLAANLAITFALDGKKVILVDGDLRRSQMHTLFAVPKQYGFADYLLGTMTLDEILKPTRFPNLFVVTSGERPDNPAELLGTYRFDSMLKEIRDKGDIIIFDSPALLPVSDTITMAPKMDGCVIVTRTLWTPLKAAKQAKNQLQRIGSRIFGGILNGVSHSRGYYPYYYGYYGYYSYKYSYEEERKKKFSLREFGLNFENKLKENIRSFRYSFPRFIAWGGMAMRYLTKKKTFHILLLLFLVLSGIRIWFKVNPIQEKDDSIKYLGIAGENQFINNHKRDSTPVVVDIAMPQDHEVTKTGGNTLFDRDTVPLTQYFTTVSSGLRDSLQLWAQARSGGDMERFLSFYDSLSFRFKGGSFLEWKDKTLKMFSSPNRPSCSLDSITQGKTGASYMELTVHVKETVQSDATEKNYKMVWQIGPDGWKIVREGI